MILFGGWEWGRLMVLFYWIKLGIQDTHNLWMLRLLLKSVLLSSRTIGMCFGIMSCLSRFYFKIQNISPFHLIIYHFIKWYQGFPVQVCITLYLIHAHKSCLSRVFISISFKKNQRIEIFYSAIMDNIHNYFVY